MERALKWSLPILILANVALIRAEIFATQTVVSVTVAIEGLLWVVGGQQVIMAIRRFQRNRTQGLSIHRALGQGFAMFLPRRVARLIALEGRLWGALSRWLFRRRPLHADEFSYARRSPFGALLALSAITAPFEILAAELLIPWGWLRLLVLLVAIYAIGWIAGIYAGMKVYPHRLGGAGLHVRYGLLAEGWLPYNMIEWIETERRATPRGTEGLHVVRAQHDRDGVSHLATAFIGVGGKTDVTIWLRESISLEGFLAPTPPVRAVCFAADQPEDLVSALNRCIASERDTNSHHVTPTTPRAARYVTLSQERPATG